MAFTSAQRASVRMYLGYPARFFQIQTVLEMAMDTIGADADSSALVVSILASLADIDAKILASHKHVIASKAEDVDLFGPVEIAMLRSEGRRFVKRMASIFGVPIMNDPYSGGTTVQGAAAEGLIGFPSPGGGGNYGRQG